MKIIIRNNTELPNKYIRLIKYKLYQIKRKFQRLHYAEVFLSLHAARKQAYKITVKLGVPGQDIILSHVKESLSELWRVTFKSIHRYLNQHKRMMVAYQK